jgi:hypothetical protein
MQITLPLTIKMIFMLVFPCIRIPLLTTWILTYNRPYKTFKMYTDLIVSTILLKLNTYSCFIYNLLHYLGVAYLYILSSVSLAWLVYVAVFPRC